MQGRLNTKPVVLVVDDTAAQRYARSRQLGAAGFEVLEAATGYDALELAYAADVVLLDVFLPDISGLEVCRELRSRPEGRTLAIVHISAVFVTETDKTRGTQAGADAYLFDPVPPAILHQVLSSTVATRQHQGERLIDLQALSYTSAAKRIPTSQDIAHLLQRARMRNDREGVTGVLLYADGTFHQYLEGPQAGLDVVYEAVLRDPLHHHVFEFIREPIEHREFGEWAMAYRGVEREERTVVDTDLHAMLSDESPKLSAGRLLLNAFWTKGLGARYRETLTGKGPVG